MTLDFERGLYFAPKPKLDSFAALAKQLMAKAAQNKRWVPDKALASRAEKAQFLHLAIPVARFYLRELHDIVKSAASWSGTVRVSKQLKQDLEGWKSVPKSTTDPPFSRR